MVTNPYQLVDPPNKPISIIGGPISVVYDGHLADFGQAGQLNRSTNIIIAPSPSHSAPTTYISSPFPAAQHIQRQDGVFNMLPSSLGPLQTAQSSNPAESLTTTTIPPPLHSTPGTMSLSINQTAIIKPAMGLLV
jgi:hypothetical protein